MSPPAASAPTGPPPGETKVVGMAEVLPQEPRTGGLVRVLGGERSAITAYVAGIAGAGAFVTSLVADWQTISVPERVFGDGDGTVRLTARPDLASYSTVYLLGVLGLLALLGTVVARPDLAQRLRMPAVGLGLGLGGVVTACVFQIRSVVNERFFGWTGIAGLSASDEAQGVLDDVVYRTEPGVYFAVGAVAALVGGVWLAAGQIRGTTPGAAAGYVLVPAYPAPLGATAPGSSGVAAVPVPPGATQAPAPPGATPPAAAAGGTATSDPAAPRVAEPVSPAAAGPPGLPPDRPAPGSGWPPAQVGHVDGLTVTSSDAVDPGSQPDILRN